MQRIPFQQMTVEYVVMGELDGLTPAPNVSIDPTSDDFVEPDIRGIRVVQVPGNLGIIDPDFNGGGAQGDRCIPWVYLDTDGVGGALDSQFAVLDVVEEDGVVTPFAQFPNRFPTGGVDVFYSQKPTSIPQGSALAIVGYPAGSPKIVRVNVVAPNDAMEEARFKEACCCADAPCFDEESIETISGDSFEIGVAASVVVTGTNLLVPAPEFGPSDSFSTTVVPKEYRYVPIDVEGPVVPAVVTEFDDLETTIAFDAAFDTVPGTYALVAYDPFNPDCNTATQEPPVPPTTFLPPVCPVFGDVTGDLGVPEASTGNELDLDTSSFLGTPESAKFTATITGPAGVLTVTGIVVDGDGMGATITYDALPGGTGLYTLTLIPNPIPGLDCEPKVFTDLITVF